MRALTGIDTDRLPDEKRRGISIELGFAELAGTGVSFIDVPGHRKLVHAMIAGVGGVDAVLLVVAADDGVMPQTREHLFIAELLGIRRVLVALTKADLVDAETLELARADVEGTLESLGFHAEGVIATSATTGSGLDELRRALESLAKSIAPRAASARLWFPIDRVFSIRGAGTVVTGTLTRGSLAVGEPLFVASARGVRETVCRGLEIHGVGVLRAEAPARVAVNLARLELDEVERGDVLGKEREISESTRIDAALSVLPGAEKACQSGKPVMIHVGTTRRAARIHWLAEGLAHLALDEAMPCQGGVGIVLRGFSASREHGAVIAGGRVLDAAPPPPPRRRDTAASELRAATLNAVADDDWAQAIAGLMRQVAPRPIVAADIERRFGLEPGAVTHFLTGKKRKGPGDALSLAGGTSFTTRENVDAQIDELIRRLAAHHEKHPHEPGLSLETLRRKLETRAGREVTDLVLASAERAKKISSVRGVVCLPDFAATAGPLAEQAASRVLALLDEIGLEGVSDSALLARLAGERPEVVKNALARLAGEVRARRLSGLWFSEQQLETLRAKVRTHFRTHSAMSVPEFKELAGISRKQAIPLLEQLDREGTTRRKGDERLPGAR
jgi:selenocysteine-specific elongation factor